MDIYKWVPHHFTGGNLLTPMSETWSCQGLNHEPIQSTLWVAKSTTVTWAGWFAIGAVRLDSRQQNSSSHKMTYIPDTGETAHICGKGASPTLATFVREVTLAEIN
jgi:hypothetical protein